MTYAKIDDLLKKIARGYILGFVIGAIGILAINYFEPHPKQQSLAEIHKMLSEPSEDQPHILIQHKHKKVGIPKVVTKEKGVELI